MNLNKLREIVEDRQRSLACYSPRVAKVEHDLAAEQQESILTENSDR